MTRDLFGEVPAPVIAAYGGGVDSTAMLIGMVQRGERVDVALFADTGSEKPQTYAYVELFRAWLAQHGIPLHTVRYEPQNFKHYPPYRTLAENCFTNGTLPSISFGRHSCSQKWKVAPQDKWCEQWEPAIRCWAAGGKATKLIGYDAGPRDSKRYAHSEGHQDARYNYRCPLQEWGWDRERCEAEIAAAGLPVPVKSACYMCGAMKPWEMDLLPPHQLRLIVLMEARAAPRLRNVEGLWRKTVKGHRGATARPGSMTAYIRQHGLLPEVEVDRIWNLAPEALVRFQASQEDMPVRDRKDLSAWLGLLDEIAAGLFDGPEGQRFLEVVR